MWGESGRGNHRGHGRGIFVNWVKFKASLSRHGPTCGKHRLSGREGESGRGERERERGGETEGKLTILEQTVCTFTVTKNCANWNSFSHTSFHPNVGCGSQSIRYQCYNKYVINF